MALVTHPFVKVPNLSSFDKFELTLATVEKCLNTAAYCVGFNFIVAPIKFGIGISQTAISGLVFLINKLGFELTQLYYNNVAHPVYLQQHRALLNRTKKHIRGGIENILRSLILLFPIPLNPIFMTFDSDRMNNDQKYYPLLYDAEKKVLDYKRVTPLQGLKPGEREITKYLDAFAAGENEIRQFRPDVMITPTIPETLERVVYGLENTFRVLGRIPGINIVSGALHLIYSAIKVVACFLMSGVAKTAEGCCMEQGKRRLAERVSSALFDHVIGGLINGGDALLEILLPLNYLRYWISSFENTKRRLDIFPGYADIYEGVRTFQYKFIREAVDPLLLRKSIFHLPLRISEMGMTFLEKKILNVTGYIPLVSILTGSIRILLGTAQIICGISIGVFFDISNGFATSSKVYRHTKVLKEDLYNFAAQGLYNVLRGITEPVPFLGLFYHGRDRMRIKSPKICFHAYINEKMDVN